MPVSKAPAFVRAGIAAVAVASALGMAQARESLAIPTPFEVGESPAGNYLAALVAGAERDTQAASTYFQEALRYDPRNAELIERAFVASLANGNMADAFRLAERLVARDSSNGLAQMALGIKALKAKSYSQARGFFAKSGSGRQRDVTATLLTAWTWAGGNDFKRALDMLDKLPADSFGVFRDYHAGLIADLANNVPEATKRFKAAYGAEKGTLRLTDAYARFSDRRGDSAEAKRAYEAFAELLPNHPLINDALAQINAGKKLEPFVKTPDAGAAEVLYGLGAAGGRQGDELAAMIYLRLALYLTPGNALATVTLADIYDRLKQPERAIDTFELVPDDSPLRASADIQTGLVLETLERKDAALKQLNAVVAAHPGNVEALTALGNLQRSRKDFAAAAATYTQLIDLAKTPVRTDWGLFYNRGISYERSKQWPLAEADFLKALELSPDQPLVLNYLGYSWIDQGLNLDEGFKMLRRAVDQRPEDGYIIDSLGWAYYKLGRYDEAAKELERAIDKKSSDPVINDHLGDAYWQVGRKLEAKFQWNHARDLKPDADDLVKILRKIDNGIVETIPVEAEVAQPKNGG